ncbi:hypothetical protein [Ramlibacter sp.]|uniref:hypothetical protein n=1 Tax=Ramlibacter sp. TaxID=1917967 RepID=UPI002BFE6108|nr:hypothetical protein [Ramlibacter sp.]HWI84317.1 hypothetical protein [Ramlibacter sp.]
MQFHVPVPLASGCSGSFLAAALCLCAGAAAANGMPLAVTATVPRHAKLNLLAQPGPVTVTAADVARGFVDVSGLRIAVSQNTGGFVLAVDGGTPLARSMRVRGAGPDVQMAGEGGSITQRTPVRGMSTSTLELEFRFELDPTARPGVYAWPVRLSISPL